MQIEFTDRYGGKAPSRLRGCFRGCEAMGAIPVFYRDGDLDTAPAHTVRLTDVETDPVLIALWRAAEAREPADDGWHFVRCPACGGTGRVPWWRTVLRLPRWLCRGVRFVWDLGVVRNKECRPPAWTWWQEFAVAFKCAFLVDLGLWRP